MKRWLASLPSLAREARQMRSLLFVSRQPPHSLRRPCQHHPAMPGNCWECHCAAANLLPVLLPRPLKDFGSSCPSCPGSWACIGCVVFHLLLLLSPPLTGKSGEPLSFSILRLLDPENLYSRQKDDRIRKLVCGQHPTNKYFKLRSWIILRIFKRTTSSRSTRTFIVSVENW